MSGAWISVFLASVDSTLVATLAGPISKSFSSLTLLSWLASAYFIANTISQPLAGRMSDIDGRQAGMIFANILFGIGNLVCGVAKSEVAMILGRVVAGLGGGGIRPILTFLVADWVPLMRRGVWIGMVNILFGIGSGLGGPFGGWINDRLDWRWGFLLQVPLTVLAIGLNHFSMTDRVPSAEASDQRSRFRRIDFAGAFLLVASLVAVLPGLNTGGNLVP